MKIQEKKIIMAINKTDNIGSVEEGSTVKAVPTKEISKITDNEGNEEGGKGLFSCNVIAVFYFTFNVFLLFYLTFSRARRVPRSTCSAYLILRAS